KGGVARGGEQGGAMIAKGADQAAEIGKQEPTRGRERVVEDLPADAEQNGEGEGQQPMGETGRFGRTAHDADTAGAETGSSPAAWRSESSSTARIRADTSATSRR